MADGGAQADRRWSPGRPTVEPRPTDGGAEFGGVLKPSLVEPNTADPCTSAYFPVTRQAICRGSFIINVIITDRLSRHGLSIKMISHSLSRNYLLFHPLPQAPPSLFSTQVPTLIFLSPSLSISLSLPPSLSLYLYLSLPLSLPLYLSLFLSLSLSLPLSPSLSLYFSISLSFLVPSEASFVPNGHLAPNPWDFVTKVEFIFVMENVM